MRFMRWLDKGLDKMSNTELALFVIVDSILVVLLVKALLEDIF